MKTTVLGIAFLASLVGGAAVLASNTCGTSGKSTANGAATSSCASTSASASCEPSQGKVAGHFDPAMSGVCRFGCATKLKYKAADVIAQPGAQVGKLTQCPVSGVVFAVDPGRPHVRIAGSDYVTCCDRCATKLKKSPRRYIRV